MVVDYLINNGEKNYFNVLQKIHFKKLQGEQDIKKQ